MLLLFKKKRPTLVQVKAYKSAHIFNILLMTEIKRILPSLVGKYLSYQIFLLIQLNKQFIRAEAYILTVIEYSICFRKKLEAYHKMENYRRRRDGDVASWRQSMKLFRHFHIRTHSHTHTRTRHWTRRGFLPRYHYVNPVLPTVTALPHCFVKTHSKWPTSEQFRNYIKRL